MDEDRIELLRRMFVTMTEIAEVASETAVAGQRHHRKPQPYAEAAARLQANAYDLLVLAQATAMLARETRAKRS